MKRSAPLRRTTPLKAKKGLDRGTPLQRGAPLQSKTQLARTNSLDRSTELDRTTGLKSRSEKRQRFMIEERIPMIESMIAEGRRCEIGPVLTRHGLDASKRCRGKIEGLHELRKRSAGGSLRNPDNLVPACNLCNGWVEDEPDEARILGFVIREDDERWDALGARNDINLAASP